MRQFKMRGVRRFSISDRVVRRGPRDSDLPVHYFDLEAVEPFIGFHSGGWTETHRYKKRFGGIKSHKK